MKSINVNVESIASALFILGYERIDPITYTRVLAQLSLASQQNKFIEYDNSRYFLSFNFGEEFSNCFWKCISTVDGISLSDDIDMDTDISQLMNLSNEKVSLRDYINTMNNRLLFLYIKEYVDLKEIVRYKIQLYGEDYINNFSLLFCDFERKQFEDIFEIDSKENINQKKIY